MRNYLIVTAAYWGFTLSDGALRMLVLFHFYSLGYSPFTLAFLFLLYEAAGIFANLAGGWLASRFGISRMLIIGVSLQIVGLLFLSALDPAWGVQTSVVWVVIAQGIAGIAKDLTKTASKSAIKITAVEGNTQLFRWAAWFTGSKNTMKGLGFFLGGLLLNKLGFENSLWLMAAMLSCVLVSVLLSLPRGLGCVSTSKSFREFFSKSPSINLLSLARFFMFGARDVWFVVGVPVFLHGAGWDFWQIGGFLAAWTMGYGVVQALAPSIVKRSSDGLSREVPSARLWVVLLTLVPVLITAMLSISAALSINGTAVVIAGLALFGLAFAINSSLHSYLILAYAGSKKTAEDVGFYYAANAGGRLLGTLLSGLLYQTGGLTACLIGSALMLALCTVVTLKLPTQVR